MRLARGVDLVMLVALATDGGTMTSIAASLSGEVVDVMLEVSVMLDGLVVVGLGMPELDDLSGNCCLDSNSPVPPATVMIFLRVPVAGAVRRALCVM